MLDLKIKKAIKNHLISDARVGLTCSGGIDSSLIVKYANDINKSFTIFTNVSPGIEKLSKIVPKVMQINKINKNRSIYIKQNKKKYFKNLSYLTKTSLFPARWGGRPPMKELCENAKRIKIKVLLNPARSIPNFWGNFFSFQEGYWEDLPSAFKSNMPTQVIGSVVRTSGRDLMHIKIIG